MTAIATAKTLWAPASSSACAQAAAVAPLVDDVITTGTTAAACAQALLHAGADSVFALAFATVEFDTPPDDTTPICEDDEEEAYSDF